MKPTAATFLVVSALIYVAVLAATGELHPGSNAVAFFAALWIVQAAASLWSAWRHPPGARHDDASTADDIPPAA